MADDSPFTDIQPSGRGFSIPELKWRELLFIGALRREGDGFVRDPSRPIPPFAAFDLFPEGRRFHVTVRAGRAHLEPLATAEGGRLG
jgi:hypothetical protein